MTPQSILDRKTKVLNQSTREKYFEDGYLLLPDFIENDWITRLKKAMQKFIVRSASMKLSDSIFDLEPSHSNLNPRLRRVTQPVDQDPIFWKFAQKSIIADVAEDLLGPNIIFHHSKLNFKWYSGGEEVKWHQDLPFWPHTNDSVLTIGVYLEDVNDIMGPLGVIPQSHKGPIFDHYDENNNWVGALSVSEYKKINLDKVEYLPGKAGSITIHHCRTIHGSKPNIHTSLPRPLLLYAFSSADTLPMTYNPTPSDYNGKLIRGNKAEYVHMEKYTGKLPPDWSGGYSSIFASQQNEDSKSI